MMSVQFIDSLSLDRFVTWLAWILLHAVWQGPAYRRWLLWVALKWCIGRPRRAFRYRLASAAMLVIAGLPAVTGFVLRDQLRSVRSNPLAGLELPTTPDRDFAVVRRADHLFADSVSSRMPNTAQPRSEVEAFRADNAPPPSIGINDATAIHVCRDFVNRNAGYLVAAWFLGVTICASRVFSCLRAGRVLRKNGTRLDYVRLREAFAPLIARLNLDPGIRLMQTTAVCVPTVLGWIRPIVLLPISCSTGLSSQQIEVLLAHELAHIKRHDYLINLLQCFVETVLYYHPAVWWISRIIRVEREHCCDVIAIGLGSDRDIYAGALIDLARISAGTSQLAMSAKGGVLKDRISRILNNPTTKSTTSGPVIALTMAFLLTLLVTAVFMSKAGADDPKADKPLPRQLPSTTASQRPLRQKRKRQTRRPMILHRRQIQPHGRGHRSAEAAESVVVRYSNSCNARLFIRNWE